MSRNDEPTRYVFEAGRKGISPQGVRQVNERTVLTAVGFNEGISNAEISRLSGLAPQTVSAILIDLEKEGLVKRGPVLRGRRGQPATPILLNETGGYAMGVEIGWRHFDIALIDLHAKVLRHQHLDYDFPDAETIVDTIEALTAEFVSGLDPACRSRLLDLGVALPGRLPDHLHLLGAPRQQQDLWAGLDLKTEIESRTGLHVTVLNDGNAGCWAELIALKPPRPANIVYLLVSHWIAAGIIADGSLWEGATDNAADLGAMLVCCGNGGPEAAHSIASVDALRERLLASGQDFSCSIDVAALTRPEYAGAVVDWLPMAAEALAQVIYNAATVVERPVVVLDTVLGSEITARLLQEVEQELDALMDRKWNSPRVIAGQLGRLAPAVGAAELPLFRRYF